jgi:cyclopropane fatty-acyl-phospholipid synthase-like methyltransferase
MQQVGIKRGASPEAIQHHYDVGNEFYGLVWNGSLLL